VILLDKVIVKVIVLDTNVLSELMRPIPAEAVVRWVDDQVAGDLHLTAVTVAELLYGIARMPDGRRKHELSARIGVMLDEDFPGRVTAFDQVAAAHYADIVVSRERGGRPISMADAQIAAICRSHDASLATRNVRDFVDTGVTVLDPWVVSS
jgi:predicted nucleic acid-binding protein